MYEGRATEYKFTFYAKNDNSIIYAGEVTGGNKTDCEKAAWRMLDSFNNANGCELYDVIHGRMPRDVVKLKMEIQTVFKNENVLSIARARAGLSQSQLAKASGVSIKAIQKYESGERSLERAEAGNVKKLAAALGIRMEDLV